MGNMMGEVAKLLGVELNQPFNVVAYEKQIGKVYFEGAPFYIDKNGFKQTSGTNDKRWLFSGLLCGMYTAEPITEETEGYKLCYVENNLMYFTDNIEQVHGDDWDDAPYEHCATPPFDEYVRKIVAYEPNWIISQACDKGNYCVLDINRGAVPWLFHKEVGGLMGGTSYLDTVAWLRKAGIRWGELRC